MEIPFDALLTLLIFLVGVPAIILQLISAAERRVVVKKGKLDVNRFLQLATGIFFVGLVLQFSLIWYKHKLPDLHYFKFLEQIVWLITFVCLFGLSIYVSRQIPEQYGQREKIIETLSAEILEKAKLSCKVSGKTFLDLTSLGNQCEPGQEREMIVSKFSEFVSFLLKCEQYSGDSFNQLIEELIRMLVSNPTSQDLNCYATSIRMFSEILSKDTTGLDTDDKQKALNGISLLGRTMLASFKSVQADRLILDYVDTAELAALDGQGLLTDVSQVLFELGIYAAETGQDFVAVAALDKLTSLAEIQTPVPFEFSVDLLGLISHFWVADGSRRKFAERKINGIIGLLPKDLNLALEDAEQHCYATVQFGTADNLKEMRAAYSKKRRKEKDK